MAMTGVIQQLKKEHTRLSKQIQGISAALSAFGAAYGKSTGRAGSVPSAAKKARGTKVRPAKKAAASAAKSAPPKKRTMSPAARKKIAAAQKLRWAKVKAQN